MRAPNAAAGDCSGQGVTSVSSYVRKDRVYVAAKKAGYRSRAAVKLEDLDRRQRLLYAGARVVDLGCWPGGWLQVAAARVGANGRVVGVDLEPIEDLGIDNVSTIVGDVRDDAVLQRVREAIGGRADVLLSDMAPKLTGVKIADRERHLELIEAAIACARTLLGSDGRLAIKLFSGVEAEATTRLNRFFSSVIKFRPPSSRKGSSEIYAIASGVRDGATPAVSE